MRWGGTLRKLVDIFCGCGGLSLGFDLLDAQQQFETVLALDNEPSATRLFNANFKRIQSDSARPVARTADICWFESSAEIQLFYLSHLAAKNEDKDLQQELLRLGFGHFLRHLRQLDERCDAELASLSRSDEAKRLARDAKAAGSLAIVRKAARTLGIKSFQKLAVDYRALPWVAEADDPFWQTGRGDRLELAVDPAPINSLWESALAPVLEAADKSGRGQHAGNAAKCAALATLLSSSIGRDLRKAILDWRSARRAAVAEFCVGSAAELERIYSPRYQVAGLLGGPPCKGFSRIGRPVANSLREQGAFAWASDEFGDERNKLVLHYVMFLEALRPDFFIFENVSNFQSSLKTAEGVLQADEILAEAVRNLSGGELVYQVAARQLSASDFAVPQARIRYIMFGLNAATSAAMPERFFKLSTAKREIGVTEAFYGLPRPLEFQQGEAVETGSTVECSIVTPPTADPSLQRYFEWTQQPIGGPTPTDAHIFRKMRDDDEAFFRFVGPGIRWMDWELRGSPTFKELKSSVKSKRLAEAIEGNLALRLILEETMHRFGLAEQHLLNASYLKNRSGSHGDWLERLAGDRPAKTVVAHIGKDTYGYIHPSENRPITIREAARLQSFPDTFSFAGCGVVDAYTAIGNAVPPLLANSFARQVVRLLYEHAPDATHDNVIELPLKKGRRQRS